MKLRTGVGDIFPAVHPIYPNPVINPAQVAAMQATTIGDSTGMGRLGCTNPMVCWSGAYADEPTRGRDVDYAIVGLNGLADFVPAKFVVPENPIVPGLAGMGCQNGILNGLAGLRGLSAIDTSSLANFMTSAESGSSTLMGITLPNWAWLGGGALIVAMVAGGRKGRR